MKLMIKTDKSKSRLGVLCKGFDMMGLCQGLDIILTSAAEEINTEPMMLKMAFVQKFMDYIEAQESGAEGGRGR